MGFKTLITVFFLTVTLFGKPILVHAETPPTEEEAVGGDSTGDAEEKKKLTPEEEAAFIKATKANLESSIRTSFNKTGTTDPKIYVGRIISGVMGVLGSLTLIMFVYSGFLWMTATGDAGKVEKARDIAVWSTLGIVVIFSSYAIIRFVLDIFPQV